MSFFAWLFSFAWLFERSPDASPARDAFLARFGEESRAVSLAERVEFDYSRRDVTLDDVWLEFTRFIQLHSALCVTAAASSCIGPSARMIASRNTSATRRPTICTGGSLVLVCRRAGAGRSIRSTLAPRRVVASATSADAERRLTQNIHSRCARYSTIDDSTA